MRERERERVSVENGKYQFIEQFSLKKYTMHHKSMDKNRIVEKNGIIDCTYINNGSEERKIKCLTSQKTHKFCGE